MPNIASYEFWLGVLAVPGQGVLAAALGVVVVSSLWRVFRGVLRA